MSNRELKFRAWNKNKEIMVYNDEDKSSGYLDGYASDIEYVNLCLEDGIDYDWMQFTGLRDKHGKEIWEGDIVKAKSRNSPRQEVIGQVMYGQGEWEVETTDNYWPVASVVVLDDFEVLGNIYENPELLENK